MEIKTKTIQLALKWTIGLAALGVVLAGDVVLKEVAFLSANPGSELAPLLIRFGCAVGAVGISVVVLSVTLYRAYSVGNETRPEGA
jgi:hypothetical protein